MRYLMTFSYDGSNYYGYQIQPNARTVEEEIEKNLSMINSNKKVQIHASGRTDAKVHALNQKAHFDLDSCIDPNILKNKLNKLLPNDIYVKDIIKVDNDFHARFNIKRKEYLYIINIGEYNPIERNYVYQYNKKLDLNRMILKSKKLIGEHNFKTFTKDDGSKKDFIRIIYDIIFEEENNKIYITFIGNGFLRYMVRNLVGTLIEIGEGKDIDIDYLINCEDRKKAGITAPPNGLYLKDIEY